MQHKSHPKYRVKTKNIEGNALVIILVMIALIAALTAVTMRSSNRSAGNMDKENARIQAERLMRSAKGFESGVLQIMSANQCSENDISFLNTKTTRDYTNSNSPINKKCNLFNLEGAGLTYSNPSDSVFDSTFSSDADYGEWVFTATHCVLGLGSDDNDSCDDKEIALMAIVPTINLDVCQQINELNGIDNVGGTPPTESFDSTTATFTGQFQATSDPELGEGVTGVNLKKHTTGCLKNTSGNWANGYTFYHTLLIR